MAKEYVGEEEEVVMVSEPHVVERTITVGIFYMYVCMRMLVGCGCGQRGNEVTDECSYDEQRKRCFKASSVGEKKSVPGEWGQM